MTNRFRENNMIKQNSIDLAKFIMALVVVAIHTNPLANCSNQNVLIIYNQIVNFVVPFFFLSSGYLLSIRMTSTFDSDSDILRVKYQLLKIIKMYIMWTLIYFPLAFYHYISNKTVLWKAILLYIRGILFIGENYSSWPLWYLLSTIYSLGIIIIMQKLPKVNRNLFIMSVIFSVLTLSFSILSNYEGILPPILKTARKIVICSIANGRIFWGAVYIPMGILLAKKGDSKYLKYIIFIVCFLCDFFVKNSIISHYLLIFNSIVLFEIIKSIKLNDKKIYPILRRMSIIIYLLHMYIWNFYYKIFYGEKHYGMDSFIVTSAVVIILSFSYSLTKEKSLMK